MNKASESQARYDKKNTISVHMKLNKKTDADIIEKLQDVPNKQGYIKEVIREDIARDEVPTKADIVAFISCLRYEDITRQERKTLKGQALAGDLKGAIKGLSKLKERKA